MADTTAKSIINTVSGTFTVEDDGLGTVTVTGPGEATFEYPHQGDVAGWGNNDSWQCQANMSAHKFCYSWSTDNLDKLRNDELIKHNASFDKHNATFVAATNTAYDIRDDIRAVKHRAVNVDEGIFTQKACWETGCIENKASRLSTLMQSPALDLPIPTHNAWEKYQETKAAYADLTQPHNPDVPDDVPQVAPRTSGTLT